MKPRTNRIGREIWCQGSMKTHLFPWNEHQMWIGQPAYMEQLLTGFRMDKSKPVATPADPRLKTSDEEGCVRYQSLVWSLLYLSVCTRPDITYAISTLAKFSINLPRGIGLQPSVYSYIWGEPHIMESSTGEKKNQNSSVFLMLTGPEIRTTESRLLVTFSKSVVVPYPGGVRNRTVWYCPQLRAEYVALSGATQQSVWKTLHRAGTIHKDNQSTPSPD